MLRRWVLKSKSTFGGPFRFCWRLYHCTITTSNTNALVHFSTKWSKGADEHIVLKIWWGRFEYIIENLHTGKKLEETLEKFTKEIWNKCWKVGLTENQVCRMNPTNIRFIIIVWKKKKNQKKDAIPKLSQVDLTQSSFSSVRLYSSQFKEYGKDPSSKMFSKKLWWRN